MNAITRDDQRRIVGELTEGLKVRLLTAIDNDRIPAEFTGHELRALMEIIVNENTSYLKRPSYRRYKREAKRVYTISNI